MNSTVDQPYSWLGVRIDAFADRNLLAASVGTVAVVLLVYLLSVRKATRLPLVNPNRTFEFSTSRVRKEWLVHAKRIIEAGLRQFPGRPFNMMAADVGMTTVLPPRFANEIRNNPDLSFVEFMAHLFFSNLPGFEPTREGMFDNDIGIVVIQKYLTSLARMTEPLSEEAEFALHDIYTENEDWHIENVKNINLPFVARLSSRIFLGEELCRNEEWLKITVNYTVDLMRAAEQLRQVPGPFRRLVHWFLPEAKGLRAEVKQAGDIIRPVLEKRRREKERHRDQGKPPVDYYDAIEWFEQTAIEKGRPYDPEIVQLFLSTVAIHTTSDLLTVTMLDIARNPDIIEPLREEIRSVVKDGQLLKKGLGDMKLMDSVIKESLRLKPIGLVSMRRVATKPLTLSDGTYLTKGTKMAVSSYKMWDAETYASPDTWDGYRFLRMREAGQGGGDAVITPHEALLVSTSERHLGFGHGKHACPGRFFAASELKVALAHILMKYDFKLPEGVEVKHRVTGASFYADPFAQLAIRRRPGATLGS
ncbi:cytochrome P450 [Xylaria bambusicola]|uniref:cytochrome P450 n=1 Tax=Xylaria bambusicola TaxID=326684 RepID=UPI00200797FA|nr:cytochrome P450 [Xylaria bambusicola]KAI0512524.1 cytochrome P450 [Xylaria bambusicola]